MIKFLMIFFISFEFSMNFSLADEEMAIRSNLEGYYNSQIIDLSQEKDSFTGKILVLRDKRWPSKKDENSDLDLMDVKPTLLELLDKNGKSVEIEDVEYLRTSIKEVKLYGNNQSTYLVKQIVDAGHGGDKDIYSMFEIKGGNLNWLGVEVGQTKRKYPEWLDPMPKWLKDKCTFSRKEKPIFFQSGGSYIVFGDWKFVPSKKSKSTDVLYWESYNDKNFSGVGPPGENVNDFITYYNRYHFDGKKWILRFEDHKGEPISGSFPSESLFPK